MKEKNTSMRLKEIMSSRNLRQVDILNLCKPFCDKYNVKLNRNDLSQYVSGKVQPSQKKLSILASALNVSEAWLMGYDVPIQNELINLSKNKAILDEWIKHIAFERKIPIDFVKQKYDDSMYSSGIPAHYNDLADFISIEYQNIDFYRNLDEINEKESKFIHDSNYEGSETDNTISKIYMIMNNFMSDDDIDRLYKLIEITFPDGVSKYNETFIPIQDMYKLSKSKKYSNEKD